MMAVDGHSRVAVHRDNHGGNAAPSREMPFQGINLGDVDLRNRAQARVDYPPLGLQWRYLTHTGALRRWGQLTLQSLSPALHVLGQQRRHVRVKPTRQDLLLIVHEFVLAFPHWCILRTEGIPACPLKQPLFQPSRAAPYPDD